MNQKDQGTNLFSEDEKNKKNSAIPDKDRSAKVCSDEKNSEQTSKGKENDDKIKADNKNKSEYTQLQHELASIKKEKDILYDKYLRILAEIENVKRASQIDISSARFHVIKSFALEIVKIYDNLRRAVDLGSTNETHSKDTISDGLRLIVKDIEKILERHEIRRINEKHFDPLYHQAIQMIPGNEDNLIIETFEHGYTIENKVLRYATVSVSKKSTETETKALDKES